MPLPNSYNLQYKNLKIYALVDAPDSQTYLTLKLCVPPFLLANQLAM